MKTYILILSLIGLFVSCSRKTGNNKISINITNSQWYTTILKDDSGNGGSVKINLVISGTTNGDKVLVETYGDGLLSEENIVLDSKKSFYKDTIEIAFIHFSNSKPTGEFEMSTKVKTFKGADTSVIILKSGKLSY